jgi:tRNA(adenine34) deaminase
MRKTDEHWMQMAIEAGKRAAEKGEVPVGACIADANYELLAIASNLTITDSDPTAHAEVMALREAGARIGNYRLVGATVYSTIEPCVMCAGALVNARVARLVFGAHDERFGAVETHFGLCTSEILNHRIEIVPGILADECRELMKQFFQKMRKPARQ